MKIMVSGNMMRLMGYQREFEVEASTVSQGIDQLVALHPSTRSVILDANGRVRAIHRLFLNGSSLTQEELTTAVVVDDELEILTAIAGGC